MASFEQDLSISFVKNRAADLFCFLFNYSLSHRCGLSAEENYKSFKLAASAFMYFFAQQTTKTT